MSKTKIDIGKLSERKKEIIIDFKKNKPMSRAELERKYGLDFTDIVDCMGHKRNTILANWKENRKQMNGRPGIPEYLDKSFDRIIPNELLRMGWL